MAGAIAGLVYFGLQKNKTTPSPTVLHYSYFSQPGFFDDAYKNAKPQIYEPDAKAIMVNHHLLAGNFIAEAFNTIATDAPLTVVLISPNHFSAGKEPIITSAGEWQTPYGILYPDLGLVRDLSKNNFAGIEEQPFEQEHGISGIVAFIKKSLPKAKVVPLIFNNEMTLEQSMVAADKYSGAFSKNVLIVGSFDFSHYLTSNAADFHDADNVSAVENFSFADIYRLDMNSHPGLAFFLELLKNRGEQNFHLLENSNSAKLVHQDILETTSYVDGYFISGGDRELLNAKAATLLSLGNVENSASVEKSLQRNSPQFSIEYLERLLFGQQTTVARLLATSTLPHLLEVDGINYPVSGSQTVPLGNLKIAFVNSGTQNDLRAAIDSGADISVGDSQYFKIEMYKNKLIFYGQGDFLTTASLSKISATLALGFSVKNNSLSIYLLPIGFSQGKGKLLIGTESGKVLAEMAKISEVPEEVKIGISNGLITIKN